MFQPKTENFFFNKKKEKKTIVLINFRLMQLHPKNEKHIMLPFPVKLKKPNFKPIWGFLPENLLAIIVFIISLYPFSAFMLLLLHTKRTKNQCINLLWKTHFGPCFVGKPPCKIFPKKSIWINYTSVYAAAASSKKSKSSMRWLLLML